MQEQQIEMFPEDQESLSPAEVMTALDMEMRPKFAERESIPVKGYEFRVKGYTQSGDLILTPIGPTGKMAKKLKKLTEMELKKAKRPGKGKNR